MRLTALQVVRRLSLASLNAAIQNKPHLIIDKLGALQPLLYQETVVREELRRVVQMGPWKSGYSIASSLLLARTYERSRRR
jgi:cullin-associated NEDD8-dissociated protein 1